MSDTTVDTAASTEDTTQEPTEQTSSAPEQESQDTTPTEDDTPKEPESDDELPKWARDKLTKANNEAARYRHELREATDKAKAEAKTEFEAQLQELTDAKAALAADLDNARLQSTKVQAALSVGIPGESANEFADLLKGSTQEEIQAHAEKVKELFGASMKKSNRAVDPTQGLGGYDAAADTAPGMARLQYAYKN